MTNYYQKYIKYKTKYIQSKNQFGGTNEYDITMSDNHVIKIIKKIGQGAFGSIYLATKNGKEYALKRQKITESALSKNSTHVIWNELEFYRWIDTLDPDDIIFFAKLYDYKIYKCDFKYDIEVSMPPADYYPSDNLSYKQLLNSPYCIDQLLELKGKPISDQDLYGSSKSQTYSIVIQILYALYLMHRAGFYHLDVHMGNIMYRSIDANIKIKLDRTYEFFSHGFVISLIDYGTVTHLKFGQMNYNDDVWSVIYMLVSIGPTGSTQNGITYEKETAGLKWIYENFGTLYQKIKTTLCGLYPDFINIFSKYEQALSPMSELPIFRMNTLVKIYDKKLYCKLLGIKYIKNMIKKSHLEMIVMNVHDEDVSIRKMVKYLKSN